MAETVTIPPAMSIEHVSIITSRYVAPDVRWLGTDGWSYRAHAIEINDGELLVYRIERSGEEGDTEIVADLPIDTDLLRLLADGRGA